MHTSYISLPIPRDPARPLGSPGSQVKNAVGVRYSNLPECEFMHMGSVTAFKGPLLERLVYFHHQTDRETEAQSGTGPESHLPKESRGVAGVKQVRSSTPRPESLPPAQLPTAGSKGALYGFVCQQQQARTLFSHFFWHWRSQSLLHLTRSSPARAALSEARFPWLRAVEPQRTDFQARELRPADCGS